MAGIQGIDMRGIDAPVQVWPRWRFINLWNIDRGKVFGYYGFTLLSFWRMHRSIGLTVLNFAIEYNRKA